MTAHRARGTVGRRAGCFAILAISLRVGLLTVPHANGLGSIAVATDVAVPLLCTPPMGEWPFGRACFVVGFTAAQGQASRINVIGVDPPALSCFEEWLLPGVQHVGVVYNCWVVVVVVVVAAVCCSAACATAAVERGPLWLDEHGSVRAAGRVQGCRVCQGAADGSEEAGAVSGCGLRAQAVPLGLPACRRHAACCQTTVRGTVSMCECG